MFIARNSLRLKSAQVQDATHQCILGVLEVWSTAIGCIDAIERRIATAKTRCIAIAFDFATLALIASDTYVTIPLCSSLTLRCVVIVIGLPLVPGLGVRLWGIGDSVVWPIGVLRSILTVVHLCMTRFPGSGRC